MGDAMRAELVRACSVRIGGSVNRLAADLRQHPGRADRAGAQRTPPAGACPRTGSGRRIAASLGDKHLPTSAGAEVMSKGMDQKKENKKKPKKTKEEKRAEKHAKQAARGR
jgi:hypothetical protein